MTLKKIALTTLAVFALAACEQKKAETSVPATGAAASAPAAPVTLIEGTNYTVLPNAIPQQQADKVEVLEFFGYFCPHCAHLEPVLSKHVKTFKPDTYLSSEHVVWGDEMKPLARLAAAVEMTGEREKADSAIFNAMVEQKIKLNDEATLKNWLAQQTAFDGKKVLSAYENPESQTRADKMAELTKTYQIDGTPAVIVGGKYKVEFSDWESGMKVIDLLVDKVREEKKAAAK
ncbi:thiol:disulfide interchange protein DsbA/DsbL [Neisseria chenwenguii]|uniref:Thiol:disulfide interchange protein DsbA n=1 Tax=Neisseria chenwenguii TaxID=1853278 RepID=A0A220S2B2_9NEIS|nr:thiol:disulfide interchange protein DsbA/DsbL [Neisseria chenwenguii]ASK27572.1 disulfide bond formation protein DsbA [Neisseria chenwenguii]ROV55541.1 thiol:disulfide interchange protein DsbA/DsbL [Neisseria chenwenguii]